MKDKQILNGEGASLFYNTRFSLGVYNNFGGAGTSLSDYHIDSGGYLKQD
jgi:hypothetical protein